MKAKSEDLIFISQIERDGSGVTKVTWNIKDEFKLNRLSISEDTWIASGFNTYVVKLKPNTKHN